jgi:succinoglycan biosynthesis protein ExoL
MKLAYFVHELEDPAVRRRQAMFAAGGAEVELFGFERGRHDAAPVADPAPHVLGRTKGGRLLGRVLSVLLALPRAWGLRARWADADAVVARNLEMLAVVATLSALLPRRPRLVYECLDIHRLMLSRGLAGRALRALERLALRRAALVITSSPAFAERYFRDVQKLAIDTLVLENKVLALDPTPAGSAPAPAPPGPPWRIAWCGVLRCARSLEILTAAAQRLNGRLEVALWGAPALDRIPRFHETVAGAKHIAFNGRYAAEDLPRIYADAHFAWAVDYYEEGGNSAWLLPNRLYESLRFAAVPIALRGVETARWLEARRLGVTLDEPLAETLLGFLESCTPQSYAALRSAAAALDRSATTVSRDDARALIATLAGGPARS